VLVYRVELLLLSVDRRNIVFPKFKEFFVTLGENSDSFVMLIDKEFSKLWNYLRKASWSLD
jgi:hypothetical protein